MRIRTIKPEFWASESIGGLTRDARLLFIGLWSLADDSGRLRGALPYLSGQLFPYDNLPPDTVGGWLDQLIDAGLVRRYAVEGTTYLDIPKWAKHQKIEKPSRSRFPPFPEPSPNPPRTLPEPSPNSRPLDLGPRTLDLGSGRVIGGDERLQITGKNNQPITTTAAPEKSLEEAMGEVEEREAARQAPLPIPPSWPDWRVAHPRIFVGPGEEPHWAALFKRAGPEILSEAYETAIGQAKPGARVFLGALATWIDDNFED